VCDCSRSLAERTTSWSNRSEDQVTNYSLRAREKRFDEIGWAPSILAAEALAKQHNRAVFLFTYDGKIDTGRC